MCICEFGKMCMCNSCKYQKVCKLCSDCLREKKQIHDVWSCTKYERKGAKIKA